MRLYTVGYGNNPSGKVYTYAGPDNYRTKQKVVVPVTHWQTKKRFYTLGTIMRTIDADSSIAQREANRLSDDEKGGVGIGIKWIRGTDVFEQKADGSTLLPSAAKFNSKKEWEEDSDTRYDEALKARLMNMEM